MVKRTGKFKRREDHLDVAGVAIATVVSQMISALLILRHIMVTATGIVLGVIVKHFANPLRNIYLPGNESAIEYGIARIGTFALLFVREKAVDTEQYAHSMMEKAQGFKEINMLTNKIKRLTKKRCLCRIKKCQLKKKKS